MGSEHSSQQGPGSGTGRVNLQRGKSVPERESAPDGENVRPGSISPGPSICSDSDLPYISYTVNRPIGELSYVFTNHERDTQSACSQRSRSFRATRSKWAFELVPPVPAASCFVQRVVRYQQHLALCSELVSTEQAQLGHKVRDVSRIDFEISRLMTVMTERQKKYAKYAEKLGKVHELSHQLNRCHMVLNQTLESMETLNNTLPVEERLEPFVWTTG
ncbi:hypothetical protein C0J52_06025 [Blattella germanica]|nr:hypothetical protein C0J52_06025 [Blattella germanica]